MGISLLWCVSFAIMLIVGFTWQPEETQLWNPLDEEVISETQSMFNARSLLSLYAHPHFASWLRVKPIMEWWTIAASQPANRELSDDDKTRILFENNIEFFGIDMDQFD